MRMRCPKSCWQQLRWFQTVIQFAQFTLPWKLVNVTSPNETASSKSETFSTQFEWENSRWQQLDRVSQKTLSLWV